MEKVSLLSRQNHADRQRGKGTPTSREQATRLTHTIMNQLTVIYLSCAKLRRRLQSSSFAENCEGEDREIQIIESAVETIAARAEALQFRLEKSSRSPTKLRSEESQKQLGSKTKLSFISSPKKA
jgi:hypothetical protein